jgi:hypothetical protein
VKVDERTGSSFLFAAQILPVNKTKSTIHSLWSEQNAAICLKTVELTGQEQVQSREFLQFQLTTEAQLLIQHMIDVNK